MAYLLRTLILLMILSILITIAVAHGLIEIGFGHIKLAIITYLFTIFAQAFVMFYFIGVAKLVLNIYQALLNETNLEELFEKAPDDLKPYIDATKKMVMDTKRCKRQTIPWSILIIIIGMVAFLLGGAHDTNVVQKTTHSGVAYGFVIVSFIGFFRQWYYLIVSHRTLRKIKGLFEIPDAQM
jgi:hypothetical protein